MDEKIDRSRVKDPSEVSGWRPGEGKRDPQDFSDIARPGALNAEAERGRRTTEGRASNAKK